MTISEIEAQVTRSYMITFRFPEYFYNPNAYSSLSQGTVLKKGRNSSLFHRTGMHLLKNHINMGYVGAIFILDENVV